MKRTSFWLAAAGLFIAVLLSLPLHVMAQQEGDAGRKPLSQEELAQLLAPIALYPDDLVAQILMASTYPLEIVQADRWVQQNKNLKGDALAKALEKQSWDPSVKSLVNFPSVLSSMSQKLDLTTSLGDAYLAQPKDVMDTIQVLRKKAESTGNLKTTKEQKVVVEQETIVIQPANPQVVYVPTYSPTVVYGTWPYPAYPPYVYYPPPATPGLYFATGVAVGMAWGYAWGHCNWHGGTVNYNVNQNINVNRNIDRSKYTRGGQGRGTWQHNPAHRKNVAYRDSGTARRYGQSRSQGGQFSGSARGYGNRPGGGGAGTRAGAGTAGRGSAGPTAGTMDRGSRAGTDRAASPRAGTGSSGGRESAFGGGYGSGSQARVASERGQASRQSAGAGSGFRGGAAPRSSGGFGGGRGGGRRR